MIDRTDEWETMRNTHLKSVEDRPSSSARGVHHIALLSSDVEKTIAFYGFLISTALAGIMILVLFWRLLRRQ